MKVAITGATGHIGISVMQELDKRGIAYKALINNDLQYAEKNKLEYVHGHVNHPESLDRLLDGCDALIHSAAVISINGDKNGMVRKVNVEGVRNVMEKALEKGIKRVVYISSVHAYDPLPRHQPLDENREFVKEHGFAYDKSKRDAQKLVKEFAEKGLNVVILNPTSVTGPPENKLSFQGKAILDIYKGKIPAVFRGGFDWVDVRDVCFAICNALTMGRPGENYLLAGKYYTMLDIIRMVEEIKGERIRVRTIPVWVAKAGLPFVKLRSSITGKEPLYTIESIEVLVKGHTHVVAEKARKELGFTTRPFQETIYDLIEWFKEAGLIQPSHHSKTNVSSIA